jgi:hypothetical protein
MDTSTTHVWLAIIALSTLVQAAVVLIGAVVVVTRLTRAEAAMNAVTVALGERMARVETLIHAAIADIKPVTARVSTALDDMADLADRARHAEAEIRAGLGRISMGVGFARTALIARSWPALGLVKGLAAGLRTIRARRVARERQDAMAVARFVDEGGAHG